MNWQMKLSKSSERLNLNMKALKFRYQERHNLDIRVNTAYTPHKRHTFNTISKMNRRFRKFLTFGTVPWIFGDRISKISFQMEYNYENIGMYVHSLPWKSRMRKLNRYLTIIPSQDRWLPYKKESWAISSHESIWKVNFLFKTAGMQVHSTKSRSIRFFTSINASFKIKDVYFPIFIRGIMDKDK